MSVCSSLLAFSYIPFSPLPIRFLPSYDTPLFPFQLPSARSIKTFLKSRLPPYAVPHVCILLDAIPINMASGKADKKKLPKSCNAEVGGWVEFAPTVSTLE